MQNVVFFVQKMIKYSTSQNYSGNSEHVKRIIQNSKGGIILKFKKKQLKIYRLCQQRVFFNRFGGKSSQKIERSCAAYGRRSSRVFCYHSYTSGLKKGHISDFTTTIRFVEFLFQFTFVVVSIQFYSHHLDNQTTRSQQAETRVLILQKTCQSVVTLVLLTANKIPALALIIFATNYCCADFRELFFYKLQNC